jgi:hypothetical protein
MSCLQQTVDMFSDNTEIGVIKQDFLMLYVSTEKVRKGLHAKVGELKKENLALRSELESIKKHIGMKDEKISNLDDLPLLQFACR